MKDNIVLMAAPAAAVILILVLKDRIAKALWRRRNPPEKLAAELDNRLLHPDWPFYERHLQRPAPAALRELYSSMTLLAACAAYRGKREGISSFDPLNESGLLETQSEIGCDIVPFATSVCGDAIFLRPGANERDVVYIAYHDDPGKVEVFAESVAVMLEKTRGMNRAA